MVNKVGRCPAFSRPGKYTLWVGRGGSRLAVLKPALNAQHPVSESHSGKIQQ
jgi:hypothetical protein